MKKGLHPFWFNVSPWVILGTLLILVPMLSIMTLQGVERQKTFVTDLLREKGFAMIRSFEAGLRSNPNMVWGPFQLQKFLIESSVEPDIDYMVITDLEGNIIADSDPTVIGEQYGLTLPLKDIARQTSPGWRLYVRSDGADTFEVYKALSVGNIVIPGTEPSGNGKTPFLILYIGLDTGPLMETKATDTQHTIWMGVFFFLIGCSGIISLILAQAYRSSETSLSRMKVLSSTIIDKMPIGLVVLDAQKKLTAVNRAGEELLAIKAKDFLGRPVVDRLPASWHDLIATLDRTGQTVEKEMDCVLGENRTASLDLVAATLTEEKGAFIGYLFLFRDMTEVIDMRKEMARNQRLASLGSLAAGIAHEIRNPLSSIKGFATYFKEKYRDNAEDGEIADILIGEVERLNRVIGQLLDFARPMTMKRRSVSLKALVDHTLKTIQNQAAQRSIRIVQDVPDRDLTAWIDEDRMAQVLLNLYLNALDAMAPGGVLSVSLFTLEGLQQITVTDTGKGIRESDLPHVYDPYFTTKSFGTGLGLAIVYRIIEAHDGRINIVSEEGKGTKVTLILPTDENKKAP
ncbi:MAG: PAS domain-containing protein [Syntrophaceae bacterium]|nr:PAS domain-containing protein [Syntrophaceae bacterium]